jgi:dihydrofolate synthase/folylpolyglutamate synthase
LSLEVDYDKLKGLDWINSTKRFGYKLGIESIEALLFHLDSPQKSFMPISITGTNGKGSTSTIIASILNEAGYKVGLFTSPYLSNFHEQISLNGEIIKDEELTEFIDIIKEKIEKILVEKHRHPTYFEITTSLAFQYFNKKRADFAILEAGMGGKQDATNVTQPLISIITNVSLEHTEYLGETVEEIAQEKAGIVKSSGILITATEKESVDNILQTICAKKNSKIIRVGKNIITKVIKNGIDGTSFNYKGINGEYKNLFIPLLGAHQVKNAATAIAAIEALNLYNIDIKETAIRLGLRKVNWPGRLEMVQDNPLVVLDCAKDVEAMKAVREALSVFDYDQLIMVIGISSDKRIPEMISQFGCVADHIIATSHRINSRSAKPETIAENAAKLSISFEIIPDAKDAVRKAMITASQNDLILVIGSLFLIGEVRELWFPFVV